MEKYIYELKMKVRDYECDLQGIVNNANYQHYLEHTRHEFLTSVGISFAKLHEEGVETSSYLNSTLRRKASSMYSTKTFSAYPT